MNKRKARATWIAISVMAVVMTGICLVVFNWIYQQAKQSAVERLNEEQRIHAEQAARGIKDYFATWTGMLTSLSGMPEIESVNGVGKRQMELFYDAHKEQIRSITRMDAGGTILFTVPSRQSIGVNLAHQKHVQEILERHSPVVSDVFRTVQGDDAVAIHVPVFDGQRYSGTIAVTINFESLAKRYLEIVKVGKTGYAWVLSRDGVILYSPFAGIIGKSIFDVAKDFPSLTSFAREVLKGGSGTGSYLYRSMPGAPGAPVLKHAVYLRVDLGGNFWSIVVASAEQDVLASLDAFRDRLSLAMVILFACGIAVAAVGVKTWLTAKEQKVRLHAERELRASEKRYRDLFEQNPAPMLIYEMGTLRMLAANGAFLMSYGYTPDEARELTLTDLYPEEEREAIAELTTRLRGHAYAGEWTHCRKDGSRLIIVASSNDITYQNRRARIAVVTDITERKKMETALRESESRFQMIFDDSPLISMLLDRSDLTFTDVNKRFCRVLGRSKEEVLGRRPDGIGVVSREHLARLCDDFAADGSLENREIAFRTPAGGGHTALLSARAMESAGRRYVIATASDVTDLKRLEERLNQSQKMESIGRLAGGVAHDFNNMLSVIMGASELCMHMIPEQSPVTVYLQQIAKAAERSSQITRQLLAFSRKEVIAPRRVDLNVLVRDSRQNLSRLIGEDVQVSFEPTEPLWSVLIDPCQLDQIVINLAVNARDAMPDGGCLAIETANVTGGGESSPPDLDLPPGQFVLLTVRDTGCGMTAEVREHIFEPFFTTKGVGQGTGLGLATVFGIVTQNNGFISCTSQPGQGTAFRVYLPRAEEEPVPEGKSVLPPPAAGTGTVLVVEDEEMLLMTTTALLRRCGYGVIQAATPEEAIAICRDPDRRIDLILTDVVMPNMNGREMAEEIRGLRPGIKVLFMSGYTDDVVARRGIVEERMHYVSKPLDMRTLQDSIKKVLESA